MTYALDTNMIIHLVRGTPTVCTRFDSETLNGTRIAIPPYVNFEVLRGFRYVPAPAKERAYGQLLMLCDVGEMTTPAWEKAASIYGELRKRGFTVDDADLLIAAFCVVNGHTLVTANTKHFKDITGLSLEDWTV